MNRSHQSFPRRHALSLLLTALLLPAPLLAADEAAAATAPTSAMPGMSDMSKMKMHGMHGKRCSMMPHHGGMPQMLHMPRLPPGNDKLQLQMEAEILQKIGEIQGKYANQLP